MDELESTLKSKTDNMETEGMSDDEVEIVDTKEFDNDGGSRGDMDAQFGAMEYPFNMDDLTNDDLEFILDKYVDVKALMVTPEDTPSPTDL